MKLNPRTAKIILLVVGVAAVMAALATSSLVASAQGEKTGEGAALGLKYLAAGIAVGLAGLGGGYAVGVAGASAVSATAEKREIFGSALLIVALGEGIAIYGLLIAILILTR